jgi:hypothetical protein
MNMSSVVELEIENADRRKKLMAALFKHLGEIGVEAELTNEIVKNYYIGMTFQEPVVQVKNKNVNVIRLTGDSRDGCGVSGTILRFLYEVSFEKPLSQEIMAKIDTKTRLLKEGKIAGMWGGKVIGVKWEGKELAEKLNQETDLSEALLKCSKSWDSLEYEIRASPSQVEILSPRFVHPERITELFENELKNDDKCCLFGFQIIEKIAQSVRDLI